MIRRDDERRFHRQILLSFDPEPVPVTEEYAIGGGKAVDLHATRGDEHRFVEVETGHSDIIANAKKCATLSGTIWFVFTDARVRDEYAAQLHTVLPGARLITTAELRELQ